MTLSSAALLDDDVMDGATIAADRDACDWPALRRAILAYGGIGPSRDWERDAWPADLYRAAGKAPDLVAAEAMRSAPWGDAGDDSAMYSYLQRSWSQWQRVTERARSSVKHRSAPAVVASPVRKAGQRSFAELVRELRSKHGADVDLSGLRSEYVSAYESGERVTVEREGRSYRGTIGATRGPRPRFVLLLSMDL